jgi:hypothetical protein
MGSAGIKPDITGVDPISAIRQEQFEQNKRILPKFPEVWGERNHTDDEWLAILIEQIGPLSRSVITKDELGYSNLVELAATVMSWLECCERRAKKK